MCGTSDSSLPRVGLILSGCPFDVSRPEPRCSAKTQIWHAFYDGVTIYPHFYGPLLACINNVPYISSNFSP